MLNHKCKLEKWQKLRNSEKKIEVLGLENLNFLKIAIMFHEQNNQRLCLTKV